jgi:hypothetical protein
MRDIYKCGVKLGYHHIVGLIFLQCPTLGHYTTQNTHTFGCKRRLSWDVDGVAIYIYIYAIGEILKNKIKRNDFGGLNFQLPEVK